jgi:hypothetical protein
MGYSLLPPLCNVVPPCSMNTNFPELEQVLLAFQLAFTK